MSNRQDVQKFLKRLRKKHPQLEVTQRNNGHYRVLNPENGGFITVPYSPSDWRWIRHTRQQCRVYLEIEV